jgi:hypothetical protein
MLGRGSAYSDWVRGQLAILLLLMSATGALACPLCYEAARQLMTDGVRLDLADRAVLAAPVAAANQFRIVAIIKGEDVVGDIIAEPVTGVDKAAGADRDPSLLIRDPVTAQWTSLGAIPEKYADWLRQVAATSLIGGERPHRDSPFEIQTAETLSYAGWRQRVVLIIPYLENGNQLAARLAWGELARAPYAAMGAARSHIDGATVAGWLDDPKLASRHAAYTTLLGCVGGSVEANRLERRIEVASTSHDAANLAAMIGADLELRGPSRVDWVESRYFADRSRTLPEIEAALLALNIHGEVDRTVPRERVIQAYRAFIRERPQMAGFVATQLADWNYWGAATDYMALLKSNTIKDPGSQFAVVNYLQRAASAKASVH